MEAEWFTQMVESLWPNFKEVAQQLAWETLPPLLNDSKASWMVNLNLKKFTLGQSPPSITNIQSTKETTVAGLETMHVEFDFRWDSSQSIVMEVTPLPKYLKELLPELVEGTLNKIISFQFGLASLRLHARCRLTLEPLLRQPPMFAELKFSLLRQPEALDFRITLEQGVLGLLAPIAPVLKLWVIQFVRMAVLSHFILPEQFTYSIAPEHEMVEVPQGLVYVKVIEARNIPKVDIFTRAAPYVAVVVCFRVWVREKKRHTTPVKESSSVTRSGYARWDAEFHLPVVDRGLQSLTLAVFDHNPLGGDDELGRAVLEVRSLPVGEEEELVLGLHPAGEQQAQEELGRQLGMYAGVQRSVQEGMVSASRAITGTNKECQLQVKVQIKYTEISETDMRTLAEHKSSMDTDRHGTTATADKDDDALLLQSLQNPSLRALASAGNLCVRVSTVSKLPPSSWSWICSRSIQVRLRARNKEVLSSRVKGSSRGARVEQELQLELTDESDATTEGADDDAAYALVQIWDATFGQSLLGETKFPLSTIKEACHIEGKFPITTSKDRVSRPIPVGLITVALWWNPFLL